MDDRLYRIGFNLVKGIGAVRLRALQDHFGALSLAWSANELELHAAGIQARVVENLIKIRSTVNLQEYYEKITSNGIKVITDQDDEYPKRLLEIDQPPPVIFYRGDLIADDFWAVAIVGTRRVTPYGRQVTGELAGFLAGNGITIVSGLARGVDGIAHQAALQAGGRTFAVLGSGVDRIYPPENRELAERVIRQGAVISDYAPGTPPDGVNFPPRNRIISGLSMAVVIVEAGETSGALITANFAADQGRDVFAVPGSIHAQQSKGTNHLIQQGAQPILSGKDLLEALQLERVNEQRITRHTIPADDAEATLLKILSREPLHIDEIREKTGLAIENVTASLVTMELKGLVQQVGGMNYVAVREKESDYNVR